MWKTFRFVSVKTSKWSSILIKDVRRTDRLRWRLLFRLRNEDFDFVKLGCMPHVISTDYRLLWRLGAVGINPFHMLTKAMANWHPMHPEVPYVLQFDIRPFYETVKKHQEDINDMRVFRDEWR